MHQYVDGVAVVDDGDVGEIRYISARRLNLGLFQKDINVAWDLARAAGVDPEAVADELDQLSDDDWDREAALQLGF